MTTHICILSFMRRKGFKHFYLVADIALVTVPYMTVGATRWSSSQNRPLILSPTCQRPPRTLFMLRTLSWLPSNCPVRCKLLTALNRKHTLTISHLTLPEPKLTAVESRTFVFAIHPSHSHPPPNTSYSKPSIRQHKLHNAFVGAVTALYQNMKS